MSGFEQYPLVSFACNDERGNQLAHTLALSVCDLIQLSGEAAYAEDDRGFRVQVAGRWFATKSSFKAYVGNLHWNAAYMHPATLTELLNHLRAEDRWICEEATEELMDAWDEPAPIPADLVTRLLAELRDAQKGGVS